MKRALVKVESPESTMTIQYVSMFMYKLIKQPPFYIKATENARKIDKNP